MKPPRSFPPPQSISAEAQAALATPWPEAAPYPDIHDHAEWRSRIHARNEAYLSLFSDALTTQFTVRREFRAEVPVAVVHQSCAARDDKVYMDIHGGALIYFGGQYLEPLAKMTAAAVQMPVVSVDYRMPPASPYPAGLEDCLAVYRSLIREHGASNLIVGGSSAGGNLAVALMLRVKADELELPAGLVLLSPEVDLTESGDSFQVLDGLDRMGSLMPINKLYAAGAPLGHPYISPLFGDFSGGFPPTFIQSGTRDLFLSNAVRLHRALRKVGAVAELHVWEALPHGKFFDAPEDAEIDEEIRCFIEKCWNTGLSAPAG